MADLVDHIVSTHHAYLRRELPRLAEMGAKVAVAHGDRHTEVVTCNDVFTALQAELSSHMDKEEEILFPMVKTLPQNIEMAYRERSSNGILQNVSGASAKADSVQARFSTNNYSNTSAISPPALQQNGLGRPRCGLRR